MKLLIPSMAILAIISAIFMTIIGQQTVDCGGYHGGYGYVQPIYYPVHGKGKYKSKIKIKSKSKGRYYYG